VSRSIVAVLALTAAFSAVVVAADTPDWAYPVTPRPELKDNLVLKGVPGSSRRYTQAQIDDGFNPPDWFPDEHPPMPSIVAHGSKPKVRACALCHLPSGDGHPESASLAGLPAGYLVQQMTEFKHGGRTGGRAAVMIEIAQELSEADARAAADYYSGLQRSVLTKVVETDDVPRSYVGSGGMRFAAPGGGNEPIGSRIIVLPQDEARARSRDPRSGFIDYVPFGSIARGEALVKTGGGKTTPCAFCHGQSYKGLGDWPPLAGRHPTYIVRQLNDMQSGARSGNAMALMRGVVERLTMDDMIAIAAYLGSLSP
jgi:cytochrome c553